MFVDFQEPAKKRDVTVQAGERVFFTTGYWPDGVLESSQAEYDALEKEMEELQGKIDVHKQEFEAANPLQKAFNLRNGVVLLEEMGMMKSKLAYAKKALPDGKGTIEGPGGLTVAKGGGLVVKRKKIGFGEEYHILGTFSTSPVKVDEPAPV